ncbi:MAG: hypothetical protein ACR2P6_11215, partial [Gammaproteobacteria bacterium]
MIVAAVFIHLSAFDRGQAGFVVASVLHRLRLLLAIAFFYLLSLAAQAGEIDVTDSFDDDGDLFVQLSVEPGQSTSEVVTVSNVGSSDLQLGLLAQENTLVAPFSLSDNTCDSALLVPDASCTVTVVFDAPPEEENELNSYSDRFD